ncbi:MAG: hypothetical protein H6Q09_702, partial [Acidobacteria bacterium]|nr:hypothetical protein [Acidobacteriota bacterium]
MNDDKAPVLEVRGLTAEFVSVRA